jgi:hypothetical protein
MVNIKMFEEFSLKSLNIFSKKEKTKIEEEDLEDDELARKILKKISTLKCEISGNFGNRGGQLKCEIDGDKFDITPGGISINGSSLKCKNKTYHDFFILFEEKLKKNRQDSLDVDKKKVIDKLKNKYK